MNELIIYRCEACGNLICMIENSGVVPECCGMEMIAITANTEDADTEKHVPVTEWDGAELRVKVGGLPHPMAEQHRIDMIFLLTDKGVHMHRLNPGDDAETVFSVCPDEHPVSVYAWCNIHGLWKADVKEHKAKVMLNPDETVVESVRQGLEENDGYCPCQTEKTDDTKCMCTEFRAQIEDPEFSGFCRCMLYCTVD